MWFLLGVFHSTSMLYKMKKSASKKCPFCSFEEDIPHILLFCKKYVDIRDPFLVQLTFANTSIPNYSDNPDILLISFLDPESPSLPDEIKNNWQSTDKIYELSRNYCYNIYRMREKSMKNLVNQTQGITKSIN